MINIINEDKVTAIIIKRSNTEFKILTFKFDNNTFPYYRIPRGGVENNESPKDAVYRKILEESGIDRSKLVYFRKVGELKYYKPIIHKNVNMHSYIFLYNEENNNEFNYSVKSTDKDNGIKLNYKWLSTEEIKKIDPELSQLINPYNLPELFLNPMNFGLEKKELRLRNSINDWERIYEFEEIEIRKNITNNIILNHIGSTAVKDFIAKPIIDILLEFKNKDEFYLIKNSLESIGYRYFGEHGIKDRHYFIKGTDDCIYFHLHAFHSLAREIRDHIKIRNVLKNNLYYKEKYQEYKLKNQNTDRKVYTENKNALMKEILEK